jgi:hypothetical protein
MHYFVMAPRFVFIKTKVAGKIASSRRINKNMKWCIQRQNFTKIGSWDPAPFKT